MKLKYLLIIVFIVVSTIPLFVSLQYLNNQSGDYAREQFANHLSSMSAIAKKRILTAIDRIQDSTSLISSRTQMRISLAQWNQSHEPPQQEKISRIINDAKHGLTHLRDIHIYDENGRLVSTTSKQLTVAETIDLQAITKASISLLTENGEVVALSQAPLLLDHSVVGYIQITFFTHFITDLVKDRTGLGETGEWLFAVRHESGDALFAVPLKYDHNAALTRRIAKDKLDIPIIQALLGNETLMHHAPDYRGEPVMASTRYLSELDWGLVAKVNESEVQRLVSQNYVIIYLAEFVLIFISVIFGVILAFIIARPMENLSRHAEKISKGEREPPLESRGWYEVKELTTHFSRMIATLQEFSEQLQSRVEARTQELNEANKKLELLSLQDPLTGLYNRRFFDEHLKREYERATRYQHAFTVVMIDVDLFKSINDTYGHAVGDEVLKEIASYLKLATRATDVVARIGGEEFCVLLPECQPNAARAFFERVRIDLAQIQYQAEDEQFQATCSFGVASLNELSSSHEELLSWADTALYQAKERGRNQVVEYSPEEH